ncbi:hypothetical protein H6A71_04370, partial [Bifidobacterium pullorum subsp. saeculare]|uniref:hypothetical protein n=1 Tax=Bifidobacterium pullorum TaxID=78448 RepID=UPI001957BA09
MKKTIASAAAIAALVAVPTATAVADDAPAQGVTVQAETQEGEWVVSFYDDSNTLIQTVSYNKADKQTFRAYALGVEAPAVDGKVFAGWATIDSNGNYSPVDPASVVTGNWAVYPMYKDAPEEGEWVVSFYDDDNNLIQAVGYKKADKQTFGVYALGVEAPAVDGKVFAGWA